MSSTISSSRKRSAGAEGKLLYYPVNSRSEVIYGKRSSIGSSSNACRTMPPLVLHLVTIRRPIVAYTADTAQLEQFNDVRWSLHQQQHQS